MEPTRTTASAEQTGRACPYCRFPLKEGAQIVACGTCGAAHHAECWDDNHGCAIMGCASGPSAAEQPGSPPPQPTYVGPPVPPPPAAPPYQPPPAAGGGFGPPPAQPNRSYGWLIAAVLALTIVVAGGTLAVVLTNNSKSGSGDTPSGASSPSAPSGGTDGPITDPPEETPSDSEAIASVLTDYYSAVDDGDLSTAWGLLSPTYKTWKAGNGGYGKWASQESPKAGKLDLSDLAVEVRSYDAASGVATIYVTGMQDQRYGNCPYEGITWARKVDGVWRYDQGYLQNATRSAKWRPRRSETLGYACESSGY